MKARQIKVRPKQKKPEILKKLSRPASNLKLRASIIDNEIFALTKASPKISATILAIRERREDFITCLNCNRTKLKNYFC